MIQNESVVNIADNTGAKTWLVIRVLKWSRTRFATVGDKVVVAVKSVASTSNLEKGAVMRWVVVRTRKEIRRPDGSYLRFEDNAIALINKSWDPIGKRIFGPVARELRLKGFRAVANMAEEII
jgi:large subunit ribosomal protein L14